MKIRQFLPATLFQTIFPILPIAPVNLSWNILLFLGTLCLFTLALEQDCFSLSSWKYISWTLMKSSTKGHTWENISTYAESHAFICSLSRVNCWVVIVCMGMSFSSTMGLLQWCAHLYWECTTVAGFFMCN